MPLLKLSAYLLIIQNIIRQLDVVVRGVETVGKAGKFPLALFSL